MKVQAEAGNFCVLSRNTVWFGMENVKKLIGCLIEFYTHNWMLVNDENLMFIICTKRGKWWTEFEIDFFEELESLNIL